MRIYEMNLAIHFACDGGGEASVCLTAENFLNVIRGCGVPRPVCVRSLNLIQSIDYICVCVYVDWHRNVACS
jgi:hypothetical protein